MLQASFIQENKELVIAGLQKKNYPNPESDVASIIMLEEERKKNQQELDAVLAAGNQLAKEIGQLMKTGNKNEVEILKEKSALCKLQSKQLSDRQIQIEAELYEILVKLPNIPSTQVPSGLTPDDNEVVYCVPQLPKLSPSALPHWELVRKFDIIDFELGNKITGAGFPVYKGKGAKIQRALLNFFLDQANIAGYTEIMPPILVNKESGFGTGQLPDKDAQMYHIAEDGLYLIPTAEVPITNLYRDVVLKKEQLPIKNVGFTPCFRREAGSWGAHVRGLNRLHQFEKVEIVQICEPSVSYKVLDEMVAYVEHLLKMLELPYRILKLCGGDMSFSSALTYDFEVYAAAQKRWLEVSSVSNFENFQANRLKCRYKSDDGKNLLVHTLNGSALAFPRVLATILENNQSDENILCPKVLQPYLGFDKI